MTEVSSVVDVLMAARRNRRRESRADLSSPDYSQALEIQSRVQASLGPVGGFKVARREIGPPVLAPISRDTVIPSGGEVPVVDQVGIELEIGFEAIDVPSGGIGDTPQRYFRPLIAIELVDNRLTGVEDDPMMKLADMQLNAGLVVGPALQNWDGTDFSMPKVKLQCGEEVVVDGEVSVPGGSALQLLDLFLTNIHDHCGGLQKGHIVIVGSLSGLRYFPAGIDVRGQIEGFGQIQCRLT